MSMPADPRASPGRWKQKSTSMREHTGASRA